VPELDSPDWITVPCGPFEWDADASRQLENFTDFGHFPWVHPGLLGDPERPVVPDYEVHTDGHVLCYDVVRPEAPNSDDFPVFANEAVDTPERRSRYRLHLPYTIVLRLGWGGEAGMVYFFASQPIAEDRCAGYVVIGRNYDPDQPPEVLQEFERTIFEQDRRVVESQRPERVPFDLAAEMHLKFDAVAINYRKAMRDQGLARRLNPRAGAMP
jgi:phenylpropionate dioxygenase-like ring-hydroxylating dioxygenase large terminal subunit